MPIVSIAIFLPLSEFQSNQNPYANHKDLEEMWHSKAKELDGATPEEIDLALQQLKRDYSEASLFWVNQDGGLELQLPSNPDLPQNWTASYTVEFMKKSYNGDPFTIVAFIGNASKQGFMVFQVARDAMRTELDVIQDKYGSVYFIGVLVILVVFMIFSGWFFYNIRKRLISLEKAMHIEDDTPLLPDPVSIIKKDEIGALEQAFNEMVLKLQQSRERERKEEELRRQLIANLSHDLRTPLTTIRGYAYSLKKEGLSSEGNQSLQLLDQKISYMGRLIENLLSYSLLTSGKYPYKPVRQDLVRVIKTVLASWYPVFEKEGFTINIDLPESKILTDIDEHWLQRMLDNLFQNILRHASEGKYVGVQLGVSESKFTLTVEDKGPGMNATSKEKGVGVGLSIISLMTKELGWKWDIESSQAGTRMIFTNSFPLFNEK
ncbi:HAMP domain-containing sensor histidine kinase [Bacillus carboniphilus]|uniref:histidine kinase n=1 Tax=Bacillus carboniphilus TaxID=86663 RepID=A0ABN0WK29_9BACI